MENHQNNANAKVMNGSMEEGDSRHATNQKVIAKPSSLSDEQRGVSFSSIEIREYPLCMGDNPGCLRGIPISIDWAHTSETSLSLEEYEKCRGKPCQAIAIPPHKRFKMLQESDLYTRGDIMKALQKVESDRERRRNSSLDSEKFEEMVEGLKRGFLNRTFRRKRKQKERELLLPYLPKSSIKKGMFGRSRSLSMSSTSCESNSYEDDPICDIENEMEQQPEILKA